MEDFKENFSNLTKSLISRRVALKAFFVSLILGSKSFDQVFAVTPISIKQIATGTNSLSFTINSSTSGKIYIEYGTSKGTKTYPYINGGFKGVVKEIDGQVDPQSATKAFREAGAPLKGAVITGLERSGSNTFDLTYSLNNSNYHVKYTATLSQVDLQFVDPSGASRNESYRR